MSHTPALRLACHMLNNSALRLSIVLLAATLTTISTLASAGEATDRQPSGSATAQTQWVGVFTGKYINGVPMYRLPPVTVVAVRKLELAKMEREEHLSRANRARSKAAARPPA